MSRHGGLIPIGNRDFIALVDPVSPPSATAENLGFRASPLVVEAPGYCPPGPKCLFHPIVYRHSRLPGLHKMRFGHAVQPGRRRWPRLLARLRRRPGAQPEDPGLPRLDQARGGSRSDRRGTAAEQCHQCRVRWEASVARCLPNRWNPLLLPGGVRPRFCPLNLRALAPQLGSNRKILVIVGTCVNEPSRWSHTDRQPGLYCTRRSCFAPISNGGKPWVSRFAAGGGGAGVLPPGSEMPIPPDSLPT